jgi:hypothetical protein
MVVSDVFDELIEDRLTVTNVTATNLGDGLVGRHTHHRRP